MTARSEMLGNGTIRRQRSLRVPRRLELLHVLCALAGGLVGIPSAIIVVSLYRSPVKLSMPNILKRLTAKNTYKFLISRMENTGFEPVTSALQGRRSPI